MQCQEPCGSNWGVGPTRNRWIRPVITSVEDLGTGGSCPGPAVQPQVSQGHRFGAEAARKRFILHAANDAAP